MSEQPEKLQVHKCVDWATYAQAKLNNLLKYAGECEKEIKTLRSDVHDGWYAAGILLIVLGVVLYQWLVVGAASCSIPH